MNMNEQIAALVTAEAKKREAAMLRHIEEIVVAAIRDCAGSEPEYELTADPDSNSRVLVAVPKVTRKNKKQRKATTGKRDAPKQEQILKLMQRGGVWVASDVVRKIGGGNGSVHMALKKLVGRRKIKRVARGHYQIILRGKAAKQVKSTPRQKPAAKLKRSAKGESQAAVLAAVGRFEGSARPQQVQERTKLSAKAVAQALMRLTKTGEIERTGKGMYALKR